MYSPQSTGAKKRKPAYRKTQWKKSDDDKIIENVKSYGTSNWTLIAQNIEGRNGKQCRERWVNHLDPSLKHDEWTTDEDKILFEQYKIYGSKWASIAAHIPGRSANATKNRYKLIQSKNMEMNDHSENDRNKGFPLPIRYLPPIKTLMNGIPSLSKVK